MALELSQRVCAHARMLLHRFYTQASIATYSTVWASGACVLLAAKLADETRSVRHVSSVLYDRLAHRHGKATGTVSIEGSSYREPLDFYGAEGYHWKRALLDTEKYLLRELGFRLAIELPHNFVLIFVNTLRQKAEAPGWSESTGGFKLLLQAAWNYANDLLQDRICVLEAPEALACACISLASSHCHEGLPDGWQRVLGSSKEQCERISTRLESIYAYNDHRFCFKNYARSEILDIFSIEDKPKHTKLEHGSKEEGHSEDPTTSAKGIIGSPKCDSTTPWPKSSNSYHVRRTEEAESARVSGSESQNFGLIPLTSGIRKRKRKRFGDATTKR